MCPWGWVEGIWFQEVKGRFLLARSQATAAKAK